MTAWGLRSGKAQNEHMFSGLRPKADLPPDLRTTPAASSWRTLPWQPRASPRSRASACGPSRCDTSQKIWGVSPSVSAASQCPLRSESDPSAALPRIDAMCRLRTSTAVQERLRTARQDPRKQLSCSIAVAISPQPIGLQIGCPELQAHSPMPRRVALF